MTFRMTKTIAGSVAALALLAGCTTATPYQPLGATNVQGGYTNVPLDQTHWRVSFSGNSLTSRQVVENYLMFRAAELTLQQGFACFTMLNRGTARNSRYSVLPGAGYYSRWSPYWSLHGPWGWHSYNPWFGGRFFPGAYDIDRIDRFMATADIGLSRAPCTASPQTFNAQQVVANLRPYIVYPRPPR